MSSVPIDRAILALAALEYVPPLIRNHLLDDPEFTREYELKTEALLTFDDAGVSMQRTEIFDDVRKVLAVENKVKVTDEDGRTWKLQNEADKRQQPKLVLLREEQQIELPDFTVLSPKATLRLRSLDQAAYNTNLPPSARDNWRAILEKRALNDDEIDPFHKDMRDTPIYLMRSMRSGILSGKSTVSSLVPSTRSYFERLVGVYDGSKNVADYAASTGKLFLKQLSAWKPYEGFLFSLLLSSHFALTAEISVENLENVDLVRALEWIANKGDLLSKLGAIEIGLRVLPNNPKIETVLVRLTEQIRDDDTDNPSSGFKLLASLFVLADGEIARSRVLCTEPPFYRRLASLAHAALMYRQFLNSDIRLDKICEWAYESRIEQYFIQSCVDMRLEPRWSPHLSTSAQLKKEFLGRILIAASSHSEKVEDGPLSKLILSTEPESILSLTDFPTSYFPGPLEGAEIPARKLPAIFSETINEQLSSNELAPSSFNALVASAMTVGIDSDKVELAINALRLGDHTLSLIQHRSDLVSTLSNLAAIAAITRSHSLANELRITCRKHRQDSQYNLSVGEELLVCVVAAASHSDLDFWREFIGDWITELAMGDLGQEEAKKFQSLLKCLCHSQPKLWVSCGRAEAALTAFVNR